VSLGAAGRPSPDPRGFLAVDAGSVTNAVSLIGRVDGRWRLLGATAAPAGVAVDALARLLVGRLRRADSLIADRLGLTDVHRASDLPRLTSRTVPAPAAAVVGGSGRVAGRLAAAVTVAGWRPRTLTIHDGDPLAITRGLLDPTVDTVVAGSADPPAADERGHIAELLTLVLAAVERRPELTLVLVGGLGRHSGQVEERLPRRPGPTLVADWLAGEGTAEPLTELMNGLRGGDDEGRHALVSATATLAGVLGRRLEIVEIGANSGTRIRAEIAPDGSVDVAAATIAAAALVPDDVPDTVVDGVAGWSPLRLDRLRLRDRLRELRVAPWGEVHGEGAELRLAAARAALARLVEATPHLSTAVPDLVVAAGGVWAVAPGSAVGLALADVLRRPGATGLAYDHARLLGPLGTIEDEPERRAVIADLVDDLLAPLGSVVMPAELHAGRTAGDLLVHAAGGVSELALVPGGLELVDLPPGERATVELRFRDTVVLGTRGRRFAIELGGGLGGLLVDLRDVPLRLPERPDRRRELLAAWQSALWAGMEDGR